MLIGISALVSGLLSCGLCALTGCFSNLHWLWVLPLGFVVRMALCAAAIFGFLVFICSRVDQSKPQEEDDPFFRRFAYAIIDAVSALARMKVVTSGLEKTPKDGRFLLVCNHINDIDPAVLLKYFKKSQLAFISKRENQDRFIIGPVMYKILCQGVNRENDREALKTILQSIKKIKEDEASIGEFPEGRITGDELMHPFRSGVFKIALKTQVPIVVCTLYGTQNVLKNAMRLRPSDVDFHLVKVIYPENYAGMTATEVGNMAYELMARDLGPDKVWQRPEDTEETE